MKPGPRADLIICDDIVNEENASSPLFKAKVIMKMKKVVLLMLEPNGQIVIVGTPYHYANKYTTVPAVTPIRQPAAAGARTSRRILLVIQPLGPSQPSQHY